jgi:hypothetical protein
MTIFTWKGDIDTVMKPIDSVRYYKMLLFRYVNFDCHYVEQTIADAVGGWYSGRSQGVKDIDCACPGNPTCNSLLPT